MSDSSRRDLEWPHRMAAIRLSLLGPVAESLLALLHVRVCVCVSACVARLYRRCVYRACVCVEVKQRALSQRGADTAHIVSKYQVALGLCWPCSHERHRPGGSGPPAGYTTSAPPLSGGTTAPPPTGTARTLKKRT